ncbi:MAG: GGDEF domain-containing phosphodiesterase [Sphingomonas sp.]
MTISAPIFVLSFRQRDELAAIAAGAGWQVVAARRAAGAERRFLSSGAAIAVIDARGALDEGVATARAISEAVEANGGALLALVSPTELGAIAAFHDAGATHFLAGPFSTVEFIQTLRFAARYVERVAHDWRTTDDAFPPLGWRHDRRMATTTLTPALATLLGLAEAVPTATLLRAIAPADRASTIEALRRLGDERPTSAFVHDTAGHGRVVQHVRYDTARGTTDAVVELLGPSARIDTQSNVRPSLRRDAAGARHWISKQLDEGVEQPLFALMIALNRFEVVNAAYGRPAGDTLLYAAFRRVAEASSETADGSAVVARMSGSSFLVAAAAPRAWIDGVGERIAGELARPFVVGDAIAVLGCRMGLAEALPDDDAASLLRRASEALASARDSDSATVRIAGQDAGDGTIDRMAIELHHALDRGEIDILFQPQVSVPTGVIVGVEALARWQHAALGTVGADMLFAAAARADLEVGLSDHIQRLALERAATWPSVLRHLRLALNLTATDIARPGFADLFLDRVDSSGFSRARLTLEVTETGLIDDLAAAAGLLATLRGAGCRVAIDDFGTGYSSLAYLKALPLDYLKIDKKLSQDIAGTARDRVVVHGVIEMARSLGLVVIAEGVETDQQLELLAKEGCQIYQGFLCSEAVTSEALVALVEQEGR